MLSPASTNGGLPGGFWNKFKSNKNSPQPTKPQQPSSSTVQPSMASALSRQRLLTLAFGEKETIFVLPYHYSDLEQLARDWAKIPPDTPFSLRVPIEYASFQASRMVNGPYIWLNEDSYQLSTMNVQGLRVEIVSDAALIPAVDPPPPPVTEMPAVFNLELTPGQYVALDTIVSSEDQLDLARMEDNTLVDGSFWGKLDVVHDGDNHQMSFSGTRIAAEDFSPDFLMDSRTLGKLALAARPTAAKCQLSILSPSRTTCDLHLTFTSHWKLGMAWPSPDPVDPESVAKVKYALEVHPGGALLHYDAAVTSLYYEAIPDPKMMDPSVLIPPRKGFAMPFSDFIPHLMVILDQLGLSLHAKSVFINNNISAFANYPNIAYRFLSPAQIANAIDIHISVTDCVFTRLFLIFRGISDDEMEEFANRGEKEANAVNWREVVGWSENSKDANAFRVTEISILEVN